MTFIKISVITTLLFGGLLAQSYATNLFTDSITQPKTDVEINTTENNKQLLTAAHVIQKQQPSLSLGDLDIKLNSNYLNQNTSQQQLLAEINLNQLQELGRLELISAPSQVIVRHKWAQIELNTEAVQKAINFKFQTISEES